MKLGVKYATLAMNPLILLPWLKNELEPKRAKFVRAELGSIEEARKLVWPKVIVNASGVGAKKLVADEAVRPVRGSTMVVKTDFAELVMREGSEYTYVIPRSRLHQHHIPFHRSSAKLIVVKALSGQII